MAHINTVHLVYPHGSSIACPYAIGRHVAAHLETRYTVQVHDWDDVTCIKPASGDVLIGHPHPAPRTVFRRSAQRPGWRRIIVFCPFNDDLAQVGFLNSAVRRCDAYLALTGRYWFDRIANSPVSHWLPRMEHVDLAVDRQEFPLIKESFAPPGRRRFLYIGHSARVKNVKYLSQIARALPGYDFGWIGSGDSIPGVRSLGRHDFRQDTARRMIGEYDFMLTVSKADANPATILEAMAWGLIPVCTPQSGYADLPGIANVPLDDVATASAVLGHLQSCSSEHLKDMQSWNLHALDTQFNWNRLATQLMTAIESGSVSSLRKEPIPRKARRIIAVATSRHAPWRPSYVRLTARSIVHRKRYVHTRSTSTSELSADDVMASVFQDPIYNDLMRDAYLGEDVVRAAREFYTSAEFAEVKSLLGVRMVGDILDIGAGNGIASYAFARSGATRVYALEPNTSALIGQGAIRKLIGDMPIQIISAYGESIPLADESIDVVYARQVLHHANDLNSLVQECARVLRPNGMLVASREHVVSNERQLSQFLASHPLHHLLGNEHAFELRAYIEAIREAGLRMDKVLGPWDTLINAYPAARSYNEFRDAIPEKLSSRLGRLGPWLTRLPGVEAGVRALCNRRGAGRMYTFIAVKEP